MRDIVFISKATPDDDNFALWLAPRLEAAGYKVFADILSLRAGDQWRKRLTETLRDQAVKMLLCCKDSTLAREGVQEEIAIAKHVMKTIDDQHFIVPLKLEQCQPVFGLANTQYVDFETGWAQGLDKLLDEMEKLNVLKANDARAINPNWEIYRKQLAASIREEPERLTSNWLRIAEWPDTVRFYEATGALDHGALGQAAPAAAYPMRHHRRGVLTFLDAEEVNQQLSGVARFEVKAECGTLDFIRLGMSEIGIAPREASSHINSMLSQAWENHALSLGLIRYAFSGSPGFHAGEEQATIGKKIPWGKQGDRRSAMLRNIAKGKVWSFGISALPGLWPFPHLKLKARVLFSDLQDDVPGSVIQNVDQQFRLRRTVCKGWRNKQWHGRLMAYLEILSGDSAWVLVPLGLAATLRCDAYPLLFTSPVTTQLANELSDDDEETDLALLGGYAADEEEES